MVDRISHYTATKHYVPEGIPGAKRKVKLIWSLIRKGWEDPEVVRTAEDIVRHTPERDKEAEARAIYRWVKNNSRYTDERVEKFKDAGYQLEELKETGKITGDCDDATILIGSLAGTLKFPVRNIILHNKKTWYHIYPEVKVNGQWITMDVVGSKAYFNREIPGNKIRAEVKGMSDYRMEGVEEDNFLVADDVLVDKAGYVYILEDEGMGSDGIGAKWFRGKKWKRIFKSVKRVAKVALPVAGVALVGSWAGGAIKRAADRAKAFQARVKALKKQGKALIVDKSGRETVVNIAQSTAQQQARARADLATRQRAAQARQAPAQRARAQAQARQRQQAARVPPGEKSTVEKALPLVAVGVALKLLL